MNILIDSPGFYIDNEPVTAGQVEFTSADGKLRLEEIDEQEGEEPSSKVVWAFSGWKARRFTLKGRIVEPREYGKERYAIYKRLKVASRETDMTEDGPIPRQHRVLGDAAEAEGLDSPVLIDCVNMRDSVATDSLWFEMKFIEYRPELLELTSAPTPPRSRELPADVADPLLSLSEEERAELRELGLIP